MDDIFLRELVIFLVVLGVFVGAVPVMIKGHFAEPVEDANETAAATAGAGSATVARGMSKRRKARQRDAAKKSKA